MKLLLTGSTGFVGRNFLLRVLALGDYETIYAPVRSVRKLKEQMALEGWPTLPPELVPIETEAPQWKIEGLAVDHAVHCAGVLFEKREWFYRQVHVDGTLSLFNALPPSTKVIVLSSQAATGPCTDLRARVETDLPSPVTAYGRSKLAMERALRENFADRWYLCLRPPMVLGARDTATLPLFRMAQLPICFKPGMALKAYSYISVGDLIDSILVALRRDVSLTEERELFVANSQVISDRELIESAVEVSKRRAACIPVPEWILRLAVEVIDRVPAFASRVPTLTRDRSNEIWPNRWVISGERFEKMFNWRAQEPFRTTLRKTYDWYAQLQLLPALDR